MIYFTADTHFGSERTLEFSRRPFKSVSEMDNALIENWNSVVKRNDVVYHLGDFGNYPILQKLNGKVILIWGNYEQDDSIHAGGQYNLSCKLIDDYGFEEIITSLVLPIYGENINLTHRPEDCKRNYFNLFGHIHKLCMVKKFGLNVGTDCHNFKPISLEEVLWYKNAIENHYDKNVFMSL